MSESVAIYADILLLLKKHSVLKTEDTVKTKCYFGSFVF